MCQYFLAKLKRSITYDNVEYKRKRLDCTQLEKIQSENLENKQLKVSTIQKKIFESRIKNLSNTLSVETQLLENHFDIHVPNVKRRKIDKVEDCNKTTNKEISSGIIVLKINEDAQIDTANIKNKQKKRRTYKKTRKPKKSTKKPCIYRKYWSEDENNKLIELISKHGLNNWKKIAETMGTRNSRQCRERYENHLAENIKKGKYTSNEDKFIVEFVFKEGKKWKLISKELSGRSANSIKNRWYSHLRNDTENVLQLIDTVTELEKDAILGLLKLSKSQSDL
ncbi:hypothetical protein COBT_000307 [Conglomerata obtusa]